MDLASVADFELTGGCRQPRCSRYGQRPLNKLASIVASVKIHGDEPSTFCAQCVIPAASSRHNSKYANTFRADDAPLFHSGLKWLSHWAEIRAVEGWPTIRSEQSLNTAPICAG
jgi:hypothetical protein